MAIVAPVSNRIYELLAFVVALYFPVALLTWLVIDKFFVSGDGEAHAPRRQAEGNCPAQILSDHPRYEA